MDNLICKRGSLLAISAAVVLGVARAGILTTFGASGPLSVPGVPAQQLIDQGITLDSPQGTPIVSAEAAAKAATDYWGSTGIRAEVLAQVHEPYQLPPDGCLCWAISIEPPWATVSQPGAGRDRARMLVRYFLVFVDAQTGQLLFARSHASPQPSE